MELRFSEVPIKETKRLGGLVAFHAPYGISHFFQGEGFRDSLSFFPELPEVPLRIRGWPSVSVNYWE